MTTKSFDGLTGLMSLRSARGACAQAQPSAERQSETLMKILGADRMVPAHHPATDLGKAHLIEVPAAGDDCAFL